MAERNRFISLSKSVCSSRSTNYQTDKTYHDDLTRRATWGRETRSRQLSAASATEEEREWALMIGRQSHTLPLRTSVSMEMIPSDQIFLPLHVYQELWLNPKRCADISTSFLE